MPSTSEKIIDNTVNFLEAKIEGFDTTRFNDELEALVADLVNNPAHSIKDKLAALLSRYGVSNEVASKLVISIGNMVAKKRKENYNNVESAPKKINFEAIKANKPLVLERARHSIVQLRSIGDDKVYEIISNSALPLAKVLGSNIAEALLLVDPGAIINSRGSFNRMLRGNTDLDPIAISNIFTRLSDDQRLKLSRMIATELTTLKQKQEDRDSSLLKAGNRKQYLWDLLVQFGTPESFIEPMISIMEQEYDIFDIVHMNEQQLRLLITRLMHVITE